MLQGLVQCSSSNEAQSGQSGHQEFFGCGLILLGSNLVVGDLGFSDLVFQ